MTTRHSMRPFEYAKHGTEDITPYTLRRLAPVLRALWPTTQTGVAHTDPPSAQRGDA